MIPRKKLKRPGKREVNEMSKIGKEKKADKKITKKWDNAITKANGMMVKIPDGFIEKAEKFNAAHNSIIDEEKKFSEKAEDFKNLNQNFWYELKKLLIKEGVAMPNNCEIGLNKEATNDGVFIVNFTPAAPGGRGPMVM